MVDWEQLLAGERLYDNDVITAVITPNAMSPGPNGEAGVDFVLTARSGGASGSTYQTERTPEPTGQ
jgi:hypothetical protein